MADYQLMAQYPKQQVVRDRNLGGLIAWAAYTGTLPIPGTKPDAAWVQQRLVAEQIAIQAATYVDRTMNFFMMDPQTATNIRDYLSAWNSEAAEAALSDQIQTIIGTFMPHFAALEISDAQVQAWYDANGFGTAPVAPL